MQRSLAFLCACLLLVGCAYGQACNTTLEDAISNESDLFFLKEGINIANLGDKLPDPGKIPLTLFLPKNSAFFSVLGELNLGFLDLFGLASDGVPKLAALVLYHAVLGSYSPDDLRLPQNAQLSTVLAMVTGDKYNLNFTDNAEDGKVKVLAQRPDASAVVDSSFKVCESWIHIVDGVLWPTPDWDSIPEVDINQLTNTLSQASAPSQNSPPTTAPAPAPGPQPNVSNCSTSFVDAITGKAGLNLLVTAIQSGGFADKLPNAGDNVTLFAPTNTALLGLLQRLKISVADVLKLGDKLESIILYHILPASYDPATLAKKSTLQTQLGQVVGSNYSVDVDSKDGNVTVTGILPDDTATVSDSFKVCNSWVYVVDMVLVPATSVETLPSPTPANVTSPAPAPAPGTSIEGRPIVITPSLAPRSSTANCKTGLYDTVKAKGMTFLVEGIDQANITADLPDANTGVTFFAPFNSAFYAVLTTKGFGLSTLANLGNKLDSLLLYHMLPSALTPSELVAEGSVNTVLGEGLGEDIPLRFSKSSGGGTLVTGLFPNNSATILGNVSVCSSVVYMVDEVLIPAASLADIPSPPTTDVMQEQCDTNVTAAISGNANLTALFQFLTESGLDALLEQPDANVTLLAPTNQAFVDLLDVLGIDLDQALALPAQITAILEYHLLDGSRSVAQLTEQKSSGTLLGPSPTLNFTAPKAGGLAIQGVGSNASVVTPNLVVCGSVIHIINSVLLPANSLNALPSPVDVGEGVAVETPPTPLTQVNATPTPQVAGSVLNGRAFGVGGYGGCNVSYAQGSDAGQSTTDAAGNFSLGVSCGSSPCQWINGVLTVSPGSRCVDNVTQLALPFTIQALVPSPPDTATPTTVPYAAVNAITFAGAVVKSNIQSPALAQFSALFPQNFTASQFYTLFGAALGIQNAGDLGTFDAPAALARGEINGVNVEVLNAQLFSSLTIGGHLLAGLVNGSTMDQAVEGIALGTLPTGFSFVTSGKSFSLGSGDTLSAILQAGYQQLQTAVPSTASSTVSNAGRRLSAVGRKLLQSGATIDPKVGAAINVTAQAIAQLNVKLDKVKQMASAGPTYTPSEVTTQIARLAIAGQESVAQGALKLGSGAMTTTDFNKTYNGVALDELVAKTQVPSGSGGT